MTNDNFKPTLPFIPKTETRIFLGGRPIEQTNQTEKPSFSGQNKQPYQSERANEINPGYGPCSYCNPQCTCYVGSGYAPLHMSCPSCENRKLMV